MSTVQASAEHVKQLALVAIEEQQRQILRRIYDRAKEVANRANDQEIRYQKFGKWMWRVGAISQLFWLGASLEPLKVVAAVGLYPTLVGLLFLLFWRNPKFTDVNEVLEAWESERGFFGTYEGKFYTQVYPPRCEQLSRNIARLEQLIRICDYSNDGTVLLNAEDAELLKTPLKQPLPSQLDGYMQEQAETELDAAINPLHPRNQAIQQ